MKKNILITGCSSGIGYTTAHYLHERGYEVYATARDNSDVIRLQNEGLKAFKLDVCDDENIKKVLAEVLELGEGKLFAVFNNAGYGQPGALEDIPSEALREQFETNVIGLHELTRQVIPIMRQQGYGRIIQHSSVLGLVSLRYRGPYNASKYAIEGLCDTLRLELLGSNIFVSSLNTGPIHSKFRENATKKFYEYIDMDASFHKEMYEAEVLGRESDKSDDAFTKGPELVAQTVDKVLRTQKPKPHYYITTATYLLGYLKRFLPASLLDKILIRI